MGGGYFTQAAVFLIEIIFGLYILAVLLRFLLARVRADFYNPLSQFIVKVTNPAIKPLRRIIPGYMGIDWPSIVLLFAVQVVEIILVALVTSGRIPALEGLFVLTIAHLIKEVIYVYIFIILIQYLILPIRIRPGSHFLPFILLSIVWLVFEPVSYICEQTCDLLRVKIDMDYTA